MATIRRRGDSWQVQVRRYGFAPQSRTFRKKADAQAWARKTEIELETGDFRPDRQCHENTTLGDLIDRYLREVGDYAAIRDLVEPILAHGLEVAVPDGVREVVCAVQELENEEQEHATEHYVRPWEEFRGVSQRKVADHLGRDISVISRNVRKAIEGGYLHDDNPGQGRVSMLSPGERELPLGRVLPLPEELVEQARTKELFS